MRNIKDQCHVIRVVSEEGFFESHAYFSYEQGASYMVAWNVQNSFIFAIL